MLTRWFRRQSHPGTDPVASGRGYADEVLLAGWVPVCAELRRADGDAGRGRIRGPGDEDPATVLARCYRAGR